MKHVPQNQWLDLVTVGRRLGLDQGLRSQRKDAQRHLSPNERIARRVRKLIKRQGGLRAIEIPGVGYRVREDWLREYEIGLEMDAERARRDAHCGQSDDACSERRESPKEETAPDSKACNISHKAALEQPQRSSTNRADHKGRNG